MLAQKSQNTLIIAIFITLLLTTLAGGLHFKRVHDEHLLRSMQAVLTSTQQSLRQWHKNQLQISQSLAQDTQLIQLTQNILRNGGTRSEFGQIDQILQPYVATQANRGYLIIAPNRTTIAANQSHLIGATYPLVSQPEVDRRAWQGSSVLSQVFASQAPLLNGYGKREIGVSTQFSVSPLRDQNQTVIALLALRIDLDTDFSPLLNHARFGNSGETYVFNQQGILLSESRFSEQLVGLGLLAPRQDSRLTIKLTDPGLDLRYTHKKPFKNLDQPLTTMAASAVKTHDGFNLEGYRDYRGITVVGAWLWDPEINLGLATEIDRNEALTIYNNVIQLLIVFFIISVSALIFLYKSSRRFHSRLLNSQQQIHSILANTPAFIYIRDLEHRVIFANREAIEIFSMPSKWIGNKNTLADEKPLHAEVLNQKQQKFTQEHDETLLQEKIAFTYELELTIGDKNHTFLITKFPLRNENNKVYAIGISGTDITNRLITEKKLVDREVFLTNLMGNLPGAVFRAKITDGMWIIHFLSTGSIELLGINANETSNKKIDFIHIVHPSDRDRIADQMTYALRTKTPYQLEFRLNTEHTIKWIWARGKILAGESYTTSEGFLSDITERKNVEQELSSHRRQLTSIIAEKTKELSSERETLNNIIKSAADGIISFSQNHTINLFSPAAQRLFNYHQEEAIDKPIFTLFDETSAERLRKEIEARHTLTPTSTTLELTATSKSGKPIHIEASLNKSLAKDAVNYTLIIRDIEVRQAEQQALNSAKLTAEEASKAKSQFLANISHEIRTPLNAIIGMNQLALRTSLSHKQQRYLKTIEYSSHTLLGVINDILDFSKIEAGKLELESIPFNLESSLEAISQMTSIRAQEKGVEFLLEVDQKVPSNIVGDPLRLSQILTNLCSNATKFTEQGQITLGAKFISQQNNDITLEFFVADTGIGLNDKQKENLFIAFTQADTSVTRKYGGTGLGLSICKELVQLMGSEIQVTSEAGKGSCFSFQVTTQQAPKTDEGEAAPATYSRLNVLLIEDNQPTADILIAALQHMQHWVTHCTSGEQALVILSKEEKFDILLVDWKLPGMQGDAIISQVKNANKNQALPVVVMITAHEEAEAAEAARDAGADGLLIKPISNSTLLDTLAQLTRRHLPNELSRTNLLNPFAIVPQLSGARLLIAEDNDINQEIAREIFETAGFKVTLVGDGQRAIDVFEEKDFDLIIMDIQMPVLDGESATRAIRANPKGRDIPIIAMTANALKEDEQRCRSLGMNDYLTKPINIEKAIHTVSCWLHKTGYKDVTTHEDHSIIESQSDTLNYTTELPRNLPGLDVQRGLDNCTGKQELYLRLLTEFADVCEKAMHDLTQQLKQQEFSAAANVTHSLKGVSGNLGAMMLYQSCSQLDSQLRLAKPNTQHIQAHFFSLQKALEQLQKNFAVLGIR